MARVLPMRCECGCWGRPNGYVSEFGPEFSCECGLNWTCSPSYDEIAEAEKAIRDGALRMGEKP